MNPNRKSRAFLPFLIALFACVFCASAHAAEVSPPAPAPAPTPAAESTPEKPAARREDVEPETLADAKALLKTARAERDAAEKNLNTAEDSVKVVTADLDAARASFKDAKTKLDAAEAKALAESGKFTNLTAEVKAALALTDEQVTNLVSDKAIIPAAIQGIAMAKAVEIAASQGIPPLPGKPGQAASEDIKEAFATAAAEPDPRKRGALFAAASARLAAKAKTHGTN
jgi:hypothetical protein